MGHFKARNKKKRLKNRIIMAIIAFFFTFLLIKFIEKKVKINDLYINKLTYSYLQLKPKEVKNDIATFEEVKIKPTIYIYNTHQEEKYKYNKISPHNIDYTVMFASYILQSYLEKYDIKSIVETSSVKNFLNDNNLVYADSYKASRFFLEQAALKYDAFDYYIDIHRDSALYEVTTCTLNDKKYARLLFVVGLEYDSYKENEKLANDISDRLKRIDPCFSRGIMKKGGKGSNGVYNQDYSKNSMLIEVGGQENTIEEVNNTLKVLASILYEYIMEDE